MLEKKTKPYTAEFKENALKLAVESDKPVTETARELEVNPNCSCLQTRSIFSHSRPLLETHYHRALERNKKSATAQSGDYF